MRRSAGKMFIRGFLQSFLIMTLVLGAGVLSYQLTMHYWEVPEEAIALEAEEIPVRESITEAKVDDISKNLIFCFNDETNKIDKIVLEIFHCKNKQLTYITIPMRTQLTMSDDLYRKMVLVQPDIPQVMQLSAISGYLDSNTVFDYGVLIIQELLGIDISYYTVIPKTIYDTIFTSKELTDTLPVETFSDEYMEFLKTIDTTEKLSTYIEELYPTLHSNLSLIDKMNYLESYAETSLSKISFQLIQGNDTNSSYIINRVLLTRQLERLTSVT